MSTSQRISEALRSIGELYGEIADELARENEHDELEAERPSPLRSFMDGVRAHQKSILDFLRERDEQSAGSDPQHFALTSTDPGEQAMAILRRDFAHSFARISIKGEEIVVEASHGFERKAHFADRAPKPTCDDEYGSAPMLISATAEPALPRNTRVVRLRLAGDHQVDPNSSVVVATPVGRESAFRFHTQAFGVDDRTIDLAIRVIDADLNQPSAAALARFHVLVLRVAD